MKTTGRNPLNLLRRITASSQNGFSLVEVLVSLALLGIVGVGVNGALTTAVLTTPIVEEQITGEDVAQRQMQHVMSQPYDFLGDPPVYQTLSDPPTGYSTALAITRLDPDGDGLEDDDGLQFVHVTVVRMNKVVSQLEAYKLRW